MINFFTQTHIGKRKINEDSYLVDNQLGLYVVADGVGGLEKGEVASQLACKTILRAIQSGASLQSAIHLAHQAILDEVKTDDKKKGMATTVAAVLFEEENYEIAWVGDSRVYLWDGGLHLLTRDDSYVEILLDSGHISLEDLDTHPDRNVISQALGIVRKDIKIHSNKGTIQKDQLLMLATDGLFGVIKEKGLIKELQSHQRLEEMTNNLVQLAVDQGGSDNITLMTLAAVTEEITSEEIIQPKIYRSFDSQTGAVVGASPTKINAILADSQETDTELIDQTTFKDMSQDDRNLLEVAATKSIKKLPQKPEKIPILYWLMFALIVFLAIILAALKL